MMLKKYTLLVLSALLLYSQMALTTEFSEPLKDGMTGMIYKENSYGDFYLDLKDVYESEISEKLTTFVVNHIHNNPQKAFVIHLDIEKFSLVPSLIKAGFKHHFTDETHTEWLIRNDSEVPYALTSMAISKVLLVDNGNVLLIEDIRRPNQWGLPGGQIMPGEFAEMAAMREAQEEVGYTVEEKDLKLIADLQRTQVDPYNVNVNIKFYMAKKFTGKLKTQESEVLQAQWIPLKDLLKEKTFSGLVIDDYLKMILKHVDENLKSVGRFELPDMRQLWKADEEKDPRDKLRLELVG